MKKEDWERKAAARQEHAKWTAEEKERKVKEKKWRKRRR